MPTSSATHGIGDSFSFIFKDPRWAKKMLIAVLLMLANFILPVIPAFFLAGYCLELAQRTVQNDGIPDLPEWIDWGRLFVNGARAFGIALLYMLPVLIMLLLGLGLMLIPTLITGVAGASQEDVSPWILLIPTLGGIGSLFVFSLVALFGIFLNLLLPLGLLHYAVKGRFPAAFQFGEWWAVLRANFTDFMVVYATVIVFNLLSGLLAQLLSLTVVLCLVLPFLQSIISVYGLLFSTALFAQAYHGGQMKLETV